MAWKIGSRPTWVAPVETFRPLCRADSHTTSRPRRHIATQARNGRNGLGFRFVGGIHAGAAAGARTRVPTRGRVRTYAGSVAARAVAVSPMAGRAARNGRDQNGSVAAAATAAAAAAAQQHSRSSSSASVSSNRRALQNPQPGHAAVAEAAGGCGGAAAAAAAAYRTTRPLCQLGYCLVRKRKLAVPGFRAGAVRMCCVTASALCRMPGDVGGALRRCN